ncbi:hypothetical protein GCM10010425_49690 [Streptomyces spororaveus]|uniref:Uncharacterized protein n=1 Tax=Streptomyces spororaveus TaxID=284039 RepID=A0ABQ3T2F5_9ACTN|nr:hypothetical protein Sspor_01240 [Streptomyces spororaveus]
MPSVRESLGPVTRLESPMQRSTKLDAATTPTGSRLPESLCMHRPTCPTADSPDREDARVVVGRPEQGWSLLCNALIVFDDTGELLPDGRIVAPHRPTGAVDTALPLLADSHPLMGGTTRSGKTSAAAFYATASLANTSSRSA